MAPHGQTTGSVAELQTLPAPSIATDSSTSNHNSSGTPPTFQDSPSSIPCSPQISQTDSRAAGSSLDGATLVPSPSPSPSRSGVVSPVPSTPEPDSSSEDCLETDQSTWSRLRANAPKAKYVMTIGVAAMTIAAVVYSHRADKEAQWDNDQTFWVYCQGPGANTPQCVGVTGTTLSRPPYSSFWRFSSVIQRRTVGTLEAIDSIAQGVANSARPSRYATIVALSLLLLLALAVLAVSMRKKTQTGRARISDQSMARSDMGTVKPALQLPSNSAGGLRQRHPQRYRAFVPAEQAINTMKSSANSSQSTLQDSHGRSSSNPWDRRHSWLTNSNPSILDGADVMLHDAESEKWQQVKRASKDRPNSSLTLHSPPSELHSPPRKLPIAQPEEEEEEQPQMSKLKRWMSPGTVKVLDHPPPELPRGDFEAGVAMIGAGLAATTGGRVMVKCPVEVPLDPNKALPDSWMHTCPQDESSMSAIPVC